MVDMNISVSEYFRIGLFTILSYIIPSSRDLRIWRKEAWKEGCRGLGGGGHVAHPVCPAWEGRCRGDILVFGQVLLQSDLGLSSVVVYPYFLEGIIRF